MKWKECEEEIRRIIHEGLDDADAATDHGTWGSCAQAAIEAGLPETIASFIDTHWGLERDEPK